VNTGMPTNIILGLIAGMTIFLGLPIARLKSASASLRGSLVLASAGVLLFLIIEVGDQAIEILEMTAKSGDLNLALMQGLIMVAGLVLGLVGLAALEEKRHQAKSGGADPLEIATMIAIGIGLHNFAEGMAIGQSYSSGNVSLGLVLVIGFALHNATEGFGIAGPLAGSNISWAQLIGLGLIGGAPTAAGAAIGGAFVNSNFQLFILSLAVASLIYVTRELLRLPFTTLSATKAMMALTAGLIVGIATEICIEAASVSHGQNQPSSQAMPAETENNTGVNNQTVVPQVSFSKETAQPNKLKITRGENLLVINKTNKPLEIESNGLFNEELFIPKHGKLAVKIIGTPGQYAISPENSRASAQILVIPGAEKPMASIFPGYDMAQVIDAENMVAAITTIDGHAQAAFDLHMHALRNKEAVAKLDLMRAGKHAHHPMHELLEDKTPKALAVQSLLGKTGLLDDIKEKLKNYSQLAADKNLTDDKFAKAYADLLSTVEEARKQVAGDLYNEPAFRAATVLIVLQQAEHEYKEAVESGQIRVLVAAQPGKDGYLEYQDTRGFLKAAQRLLECPSDNLCGVARLKIGGLVKSEFNDVDPKNPARPTPFPEIEKRFEEIEKLIEQVKPKKF